MFDKDNVFKEVLIDSLKKLNSHTRQSIRDMEKMIEECKDEYLLDDLIENRDHMEESIKTNIKHIQYLKNKKV